ncbi:dynamin-binding protein-like [Lineus longissimus]|uniref:dynamin-binding protein-like n=1 Tax=Lineus longissimus TaxID=88925 RepID=UPI002B4F33E2
MARYYVRAAYEFPTNEPGEIQLKPGDVVLVTGQINADWLSGSLNGRLGNFPSNFVEDLHIPELTPGQKLFEAITTFPATVSGDLGFKKGELVVGTQKIDENWWRGEKRQDTGIFPITHVKQLQVDIGADSVDSIDSGTPNGVHQETDTAATAEGIWNVMVRANSDLTAQIDGELTFSKGDVIYIKKAIDESFYLGECNGQTGTFPIFWVDVVDKDDFLKLKASITGGPTSAVKKSFGKTSAYKEATQPDPELTTLLPPTQTASADYEEYKGRTASFNRNNTRSYDTELQAYGRTLYPFVGKNHNELTFLENEIVNLIRHIDDQWTEGEIDGRFGLFPTNFVEIIVDCPYDTNDSITEREDETATPQQDSGEITSSDHQVPTDYSSVASQNSTDIPQYNHETAAQATCDLSASETDVGVAQSFETEQYALVLYDYESRNDGELSIRHGETVTILKTLDEHWYEVRDDDGNVGYCPINYVQVIGAEPELDVQSVTEEQPVVPVVSVEGATTSSTSDTTTPVVSVVEEKSIESIVKNDPVVVSKPAVSPKPVRALSPLKPPLKPKPELKPKPRVAVNKTHSMHAPHLQTNHPVPVQRQPMLLHSQISLDDMIKDQMGKAKREAELRSSSSGSINSLGSDGPRSRTASTHSQGYPGVEIAPGSTIWYSDLQGVPIPQPLESGLNTYNSLPLPKTSTNKNLHRQTGIDLDSSGSFKKLAPPRPTGPRPPPAPPKQPLVPVPPGSVGRSQFHTAKPVPQRAAPMPPMHRQHTAKPSRPLPPSKTGNLVHLDTSMTDIGDNDNSDIAQDLINRITETEQDLQNYKKCKKDSEQKLLQAGGHDESSDIGESIEFYSANISGLTAELTALKKSLNQLHSKNGCVPQAAPRHRMSQEVDLQKQMEEMKKKMKEKREKVIEELIDTEKRYMKDLGLCQKAFLSQGSAKCSAVDMDTLFCNIQEIFNLSRFLLKDLEANISGKEFDQQTVGLCFLEFAPKMTSAYAPYCRNHDDVMALLEKYEDNTEVQEFIKKGLATIRKESNVFDLGSLLIKPVQRILKYPLLLNELFKATDDSHPDKEPLLKAIKTMTDVATAINEYKRRKDLVYKYRQDSDTSFGEKIAKLNLHSIKKKSTRIGARLSSSLGVANMTVDENFNREENKFKYLDRAIRLFVKNISTYMEQMKDTTMFLETISSDLSEYYMEKNRQQEVQQYQDACNTIGVDLMDKFRAEVDSRTLDPLNKLLVMFHGPGKVIKKRLDKLIDFDHMTGSVKRAKDPDQLRQAKEDQEIAKKNYMALNAQLLDELPKLYTLALEVFQEAIRRFVSAQQRFMNGALSQMQTLVRLPLFAAGNENIIEQFNIRHTEAVDRMSDITFLPKNFNPRQELKIEQKKSRRSSTPVAAGSGETVAAVQSDSQKALLRSRYLSNEKLYTVTATYEPIQLMDIPVNEGDLVGLIKEQDPMGNKERWFVDTGGEKGFLPKKFLKQVTVSTSSAPVAPPRQTTFMTEMDTLFDPPSYNEAILSPPPNGDSVDVGSLSTAMNHRNSLESERRERTNSSSCESYRAAYSFTARNENEMSLHEEQIVTVVQKHDLEGNKEWWLVKTGAGQGYAPASYLTLMS